MASKKTAHSEGFVYNIEPILSIVSRSHGSGMVPLYKYATVSVHMKKVIVDEQKIDELLSRGVSEVLVREDLKKKLMSGKRLRVKLGIDPTSPHIHIGRSIPLLKLRDFEELGHQVVLIVGDFTGLIGDTSDKESERPMLDKKVIDQNKKSYFAQVAKIIDTKKAELHYNSAWLGKLKYADIGAHADVFSVADFIARENIAKRLEKGSRVSLRELLYPLMQGYDSVAIKADVELGGTDQKFNVLAGRPLQEKYGQEAQNVILNPLINGLDGRKMSSSWGNVINLETEAPDMYGKVMSMADTEIVTYFNVVTRVPLTDVHEIERALKAGMNPRDAKMKLAREIVRMYHGEKAAGGAEAAFIATFQEKSIPDDIPTVKVKDSSLLPDAFVKAGVVASKSELTRLLQAGGVRHAESGEKIIAVSEIKKGESVLKVGKRRFVKVVVG